MILSMIFLMIIAVEGSKIFTPLEIDNFPCSSKRLKTTKRYVCDALGTVTCMNGWKKGDHEDLLHPCSQPVCQDGCVNGRCIAPDTCACNVGWSGKNCTTCIPFPGCDHGGCEDKPFTCKCDQGFEGSLCDKPVCESCINGICKSSGECSCYSGWSKLEGNCSVCLKNPGCKNGGCIDSNGVSVGNGCFCNPGWKGALCDQPNCVPDCVNGKCQFLNNKPCCVCDVGWQGMNCARCVPHPGCPGFCRKPWECICDPQATNDLCLECGCSEIGSFNSTCVFNPNSTCLCRDGFTGLTCHQSLQHDVGSISENSRRVFVVRCDGPCMNGSIEITGTGDSDLYASVDSAPEVIRLDCSNCFCSSTRSGFPDSCEDINLQNHDNFFFMIFAYVSSSNVQWSATGININSITEIV